MIELPPLHYTGILPVAALVLFIAIPVALVAGRRRAARLLAITGSLLLLAGWLVYEIPFITLDYSLHEVYWNTSPGLPLWMRIASAWAGGGGSLFLFTVIAATGFLAVQRRVAGEKKFLLAYAALQVSVLLAAFFNDAFTLIENPPPSGAGLNPLLKSPWLYPHPLTTFGGYALLALGSLAVLLGGRGAARRGIAVYGAGWALLTLGIMLGGLWSYETFGWGGYWAWDPVETSELMVWLVATTLFHLSVAAPSTRRAFLSLTAGSVLLAMYITRTGLSPLHSFAAPSIGALILLAGGLAGLAGFLYYIGYAAPLAARELWKSIRRSLYGFGVGVAGVSLAIAAFFVYGTMLVPSVLTAIGISASVPQMDSGIAYFHPVLYPLALVFLAAIPASFLSERYGWKGYLSLIVSGAIVSAVAGLAALAGLLQVAPLSPPTTNAMMVVGVVWASIALAATGGDLAARLLRGPLALVRDRMAGVSLLHMGMALTLLGVLLSGTYAYNQQYFREYSLRPGGEVVLPGGYTLSLEGYKYSISNSSVDIYTQYVGRAETYYLAWIGLNTLTSDLGDMVSSLLGFEKKLAGNETLRLAASLASREPVETRRLVVEVEEVVQRDLSSNATLALPPYNATRPARLVLENTTWWFNVRPLSTGQGVLVATELQLVGKADRIVVENIVGAASKKPVEIPSFHTIYEVSTPNATLRLDGAEVEVSNITILPAAVVEGSKAGTVKANISTIILSNAYLVIRGRLAENGTGLVLPSLLDKGLVVYLYYRENRDPYLDYILNSSLRDLLRDPHSLIFLTHSQQCLSAGRCEGYVDAPRLVPESAWLDLKIAVRGPGGFAEERNVRLRFEAYGEIQGIHGLVPQVVRIPSGVDEVYIVVHVPVVEENIPVRPSYGYHELLVYYLHEAFKKLSPRERLALTALMASGYTVDDMRRLLREAPQSATYLLEKSIIDLYLLAEHYDPAHSVVAEKGVVVQVKVIPGASLVFYGPLLMALAETLVLVSAAYTGRRRSAGKA